MTIRTTTRRRLTAFAAAAGLVAAATTLLAGPAQSAPKTVTPAACPDSYPVANLTAHQPVTGLTVSSGNTPDTFTGEVLGVLTDGIAPSLDMILVRLTSPEIDRVGGIWAGMSGSPVYASDGRLIGAVAYGLAFGPSPVAGVTPAADMRALLGGDAAATSTRLASSARHVALSQPMQQRLVSDGVATSAEADQGLARLPLPLGLSGLASTARLTKAASLIPTSDVRLYRASAAPSTPADDSLIFPGSNLAASMSYGDFSAVGTGTTTLVCDGQVVGFGHPFNWTGDSSMTLHGADAIVIQEDPTIAGFKVSNPTGPVGVIDGDHLAGISGLIGDIPDTTLVQSMVTLTGGGSRTGDSYVSVPDFLPTATAFAEIGNQDRVFDRVGAGSSLVHFTVDGTTSLGEPFTLVRTNRYASPDDISVESVFEASDDVARILQNRFTDVTIDAVRITTEMSPVDRAFVVGKVERKIGDTFKRLTHSAPARVRTGSTITLRVTLTSLRNALGTKVVLVHVKVPTARAGSFGALNVGQPGSGGGGEFGATGQAVVSPARAGVTSFDGLLNRLSNAPRNDQLQAEIDLFTQAGQHTSVGATSVGDVVQGGRTFELQVIR
jgi:SpoIVB peptidase S55